MNLKTKSKDGSVGVGDADLKFYYILWKYCEVMIRTTYYVFIGNYMTVTAWPRNHSATNTNVALEKHSYVLNKLI